MNKNYRITVIGLGYVGLPLAVEFGKKYKTVGIDINNERIDELKKYKDSTLEIESLELKNVIENDKKKFEKSSKGLFVSLGIDEKSHSDIYIITVPTPIDKNKNPNLSPLISASKTVGKNLKKENIVIYESTVYPGATEEDCVPILEKFSGLQFNKDFFVGYSPERINPGDKNKTLTKILKVTSGSSPEAAEIIDNLYKTIIKAGTHLAPSIKVAEAAKVIENSQRDINIAFINELSKIFNLMDINTYDVLNAASTKWNFLKFKPGLVGGHCIGVDPYYLAQKSIRLGYHPEIILSGRKLNDSMGKYVAAQLIKFLNKSGKIINKCNVLVMGITFKENCPDIRNTKVIDMIYELEDFGLNVKVIDPWANKNEVKKIYGLSIIDEIDKVKYDGIVLAVAHNEFLNINFDDIKNRDGVIYDLKGVLENKADYTL